MDSGQLPGYITLYWGKARPATAGGAPEFHPLAYHSLDVAAVLGELFVVQPALLARLDGLAGLAGGGEPMWLSAAALHDLGKFAPGFQGLVPALLDALKGERPTRAYDVRHDSMGFALAVDTVLPELHERGLLSFRIDLADADEDTLIDIATPVFAAATGHHGAPPRAEVRARRHFDLPSRTDALSFAVDVVQLLGSVSLSASARGAAERWFVRASWLLAGTLIIADWLGSNQDYFPYERAEHSLSDYWDLARQRARRAVRGAGLVPPQPSTRTGIQTLFPHVREPSPMQRAAEGLTLADGPSLTIIEDATGSGKTEAGVALAHRTMAAGAADGLYIALPTQATASGMFGRIASMFERLYRPGPQPSLVLAHSARHLFGLELGETPTDLSYDSELSASIHCSRWLADGRKKALLANVGVGTLDQALIGVLPAKHSPLRLAGLHRKVLLCDEVHAYDEYTTRLLERLLTFHAALGGSAILLSATMPRHLKERFAWAFSRGSGGPDRVELQSDAFPLLTHVWLGGVSECAVASRPGTEKTTALSFVEEAAGVEALLADAADGGQCAAWIRNTVDDAIGAYRRLAARLGRERVHLFHARFVMGHRLAIERGVLARFGADSGPAERRGHVLVATQVVEQSLDLDFDVMATDLAPMDLLLQRAGRLRRHARGRDGARVSGADRRGAAVLHVLAPRWDPDPNKDWVAASDTPRTRFVYEDLGQLWRTMKVGLERGRLAIPTDARVLIEPVFGPAAQCPDGLSAAVQRAHTAERIAGSVADLNALELDRGYLRTEDSWLDDRRTPTRLGDESTTVRLGVVDGETLVPLAAPGRDDFLAWELSSLRVRATRACERLPGDHDGPVARAVASMKDSAQWALVLPLVPVGPGFRGRALGARGRETPLLYSEDEGLMFEGED